MLPTRSHDSLWQSRPCCSLSSLHTGAIFRATLALLGVSALFAQERMSQEELAVRSAYASVALASRVGSMVNSPGWELGEPQLTIRIDAVRTGRIADLLDKRLSDQVTMPSAPTLQIGPGSWSYNEHHLATIVRVGDWGAANPSAGGVDQLRNITFRQVLKGTGWDPSSWAGFSVLLSADGHERWYSAMFLFEDGNAGGPPTVRIIDYILGASTLDTVMHSNLAKDVLALPDRIRELCATAVKTSASVTPADAAAYGHTKSIGADKLLAEALKVAPDCVVDSLTGLCCDPSTGECGLKR
jgi:hypothetical protein